MKTHNLATRPALVTAVVLMLPLLAMLFTGDMGWGLLDFLAMGALVFGMGLTYELAARKARNVAYRAAAGLALVAAFLLVWINLAVGIIGSEDNVANVMYVGVLAVGFLGALIARFRPHGMARTLFAMALAQALVAAVAMIFRLGSPGSGPLELLGLNGFFVALWVGSALLFRTAAREQPRAGAGRAG